MLLNEYGIGTCAPAQQVPHSLLAFSIQVANMVLAIK